MNKLTVYSLSVFLMSALFFSCVSNKKYQESLAKSSTLSQQNKTCEKKLEGAQNENKRLLDDLRKSEKQISDMAADTTRMGEQYRSIYAMNSELERLYRQLMEQNEALISNSSSEKRELVETLAALQAEINQKDILLTKKEENNESLLGSLGEREAKVRELEAELADREATLLQIQADLEAREARVNELEAAIASQEAQAKALKDKLSAALLNFSDSDLSVEERNGRVYVSMSQNLLFATGSKTIDSKGREALRSLAQVLNTNPDIDIMIEGHTDSIGEANTNWDLSVLRATTIVKELLRNSVSAERITASGKGEHAPIADNINEEGRSLNRRTEVILTPKLDELYDILNN